MIDLALIIATSIAALSAGFLAGFLFAGRMARKIWQDDVSKIQCSARIAGSDLKILHDELFPSHASNRSAHPK